jgi:hypothetical protein
MQNCMYSYTPYYLAAIENLCLKIGHVLLIALHFLVDMSHSQDWNPSLNLPTQVHTFLLYIDGCITCQAHKCDNKLHLHEKHAIFIVSEAYCLKCYQQCTVADQKTLFISYICITLQILTVTT